MAAEGIEKAAKAKDCFVKIETRGSGGAKNVLTEQEIQDADCIIVAADAQVPMDRFDGKKFLWCLRCTKALGKVLIHQHHGKLAEHIQMRRRRA